MIVVLQDPSSHETRTVRRAIMLSNDIPVVTCTANTLRQHARVLNEGALPVGSVEFVRAAMRLAHITEPANMSYPPQVREYLCRSVQTLQAGQVIGHVFVKPVQTKLFTGFVFDTMKAREQYSEHDQEQYDLFMSMSPAAQVYTSDPVEWRSEWRYYVAKGCIIGQARYDQGEDDNAPVPNIEVVQSCVNDLALDHPYALDFGVLSSGETALVEVNDAWAIGLYGTALPAHMYMSFLQERWSHLFSANHRTRNFFKNPLESRQCHE